MLLTLIFFHVFVSGLLYSSAICLGFFFSFSVTLPEVCLFYASFKRASSLIYHEFYFFLFSNLLMSFIFHLFLLPSLNLFFLISVF